MEIQTSRFADRAYAKRIQLKRRESPDRSWTRRSLRDRPRAQHPVERQGTRSSRPFRSGRGPRETGGSPDARRRGPTLADLDQTTSDSDQTSAEDDEAVAVSDQAAADDDQAASDRDFAAGGTPRPRVLAPGPRAERQTTARRQPGPRRIGVEPRFGRQRPLPAVWRGTRRRRCSTASSTNTMLPVESYRHHNESRSESRASENRRRAAADRRLAAEARNRAAVDRKLAAADRAAAAIDRKDAQEDREALLRQVAISEPDALTGARTRGPGLADPTRDRPRQADGGRPARGRLRRRRRAEEGQRRAGPLGRRRPAGDSVRVIRDHLRSYDSVVRIGGDEFLCVISGAAVPVAASA